MTVAFTFFIYGLRNNALKALLNFVCTMSKSLRPLKITIVGDGMVGKTCLLITYTQNEFPEEYIPTVFDNHACNITVDDNEYNLTLWDTAGQEDYERLRPLSYPNTNCFLLCYSISSRTSFENIKSKWWPEIRHFGTNVPVVLVGTKLDLRIPNSEKFVTTQEGRRLRKEIHAHSLVECSAKKKLNLEQVFEEAVRAVEKKPGKTPPTCKIL
ncbi:ras-like GTP-binding protein RhoL isoform X1 [Drosophila hydei]|nr:ras-like GTP-binding protein RhoL isoform X1 [Drosophila hydei]